MITKVRVLRTLKAGESVWHEGEIISKPVPDTLVNEVSRGWVEVLETGPETSVVRAKAPSEVTTATTVKTKKEEPKRRVRL